MTQSTPSTPEWSRKITKLSLPILVLAIAGVSAWQIMASAPTAGKRAPQAQARLVEVKPIVRKDINVTVTGLGTVIPSRQLQLYPEVSGQIEQIREQLIPGSQIKTGELLITVEDLEYQIQVQKQQAAVAQAQANLQKEIGQQAIAQQEYQLINRKLTPAQEALVLRQPELITAQANLDQAKAVLAEAELNLKRTKITAPFDAQVIERSIETGSQISANTSLMNIVATDEFWLELEIPAEDLQWLEFGKQGNPVTLTSPAWSDKSRTGRLLSLSPELDSGSRMAKVIISIDDPLALKPEHSNAPKVLLNDLLRAEIQGTEVKMAAVIPDALIHNGNKIWLYRNDNTLEIRTVEPVYRDADKALITDGLNYNDRLITSSLTAAVDGMTLRTLDQQSLSQDKKQRIVKRSEQE